MNQELFIVPDEKPSVYLDMPQGLSGYWWETDNQVCVPLVMASQPGDGSFSRFLVSIEDKGKTVFFPSIVNAKLEAILKSRGYVSAGVDDPDMGFVDGLALIRKR